MKNLGRILLKGLILSSVISLISCNNDDDNDYTPSIYGNWKFIGYTVQDQFYGDVDECYNVTLFINADNTGSKTIDYCNSETEVLNFTVANDEGNDKIFYYESELDGAEKVTPATSNGKDQLRLFIPGQGPEVDIYERQ